MLWSSELCESLSSPPCSYTATLLLNDFQRDDGLLGGPRPRFNPMSSGKVSHSISNARFYRSLWDLASRHWIVECSYSKKSSCLVLGSRKVFGEEMLTSVAVS